MINHYKRCTGLNEAKIRQYLLPATDVWLSAKEAKKYGICDSIKDLK
jgi:ATP-dependent protease ClpP protease subunit